MRKTFPFRLWFYFRQGWSVYFAFIFAAINTMVVTYYLAIKDVPFLKEVFPTFLHYLIVLACIGIPSLTLVGYIHMKRSAAYKAEAEIGFEANPFVRRTLDNTEVTLELYLKMSEILVKLSKNEKISEEELQEISILQKNMRDHIDESIHTKSK